MSTKIYNAYEWKGTMPELLVFLAGIKKSYNENINDRMMPFAEKLYEQQKDSDDEIRTFVRPLADEIEKAFKENGYSPLNFQASAVVYFYGNRKFVQFFGLDAGNEKLAIHSKLFDFHYQNQVDKPEDLTDRAWNKRERIWSAIFKTTWTPSEAGLNYVFFGFDDIWRLCMNFYRDINIAKRNGKM
jgi:hypothetical protein